VERKGASLFDAGMVGVGFALSLGDAQFAQGFCCRWKNECKKFGNTSV
jgi:hypothetical protein